MGRGFLSVDSARMGTSANLTVTSVASSAASAAFGTMTHQIRVSVTVGAVTFQVGSAPTAAATDALLPINWVEYIKVNPGEKIAVFGIAGATAGVFNYVEIVQ